MILLLSQFFLCSVTCCNQPSLSPSLSPPLSLPISPLSLLSSFRSFCLSDQSCCHRVARVLHTSNTLQRRQKKNIKNIEKERGGRRRRAEIEDRERRRRGEERRCIQRYHVQRMVEEEEVDGLEGTPSFTITPPPHHTTPHHA